MKFVVLKASFEVFYVQAVVWCCHAEVLVDIVHDERFGQVSPDQIQVLDGILAVYLKLAMLTSKYVTKKLLVVDLLQEVVGIVPHGCCVQHQFIVVRA